jgi:hypothetical protein
MRRRSGSTICFFTSRPKCYEQPRIGLGQRRRKRTLSKSRKAKSVAELATIICRDVLTVLYAKPRRITASFLAKQVTLNYGYSWGISPMLPNTLPKFRTVAHHCLSFFGLIERASRKIETLPANSSEARRLLKSAMSVANLANSRGLNANDVINGLAQAFRIGIDVATDLAAQAGYVFSNWIGSVERALGINLDFSCIVEISNKGGQYDLILENHRINQGNYAVRPPDRIGSGRVGRFWLQDPKGTPLGADGWAQYYYVDSANNRHSVKFTYACPTGWDPNVAATSAPFNFYTKSGSVNSAWSGINQIITGGHPLFVAFVYGNTPAPS